MGMGGGIAGLNKALGGGGVGCVVMGCSVGRAVDIRVDAGEEVVAGLCVGT